MSISLLDEHAYSFRGGSFKLVDCDKLCNNIPSNCKHGEFSLLEEGTLPVCVSQIHDAEAPLDAQYLDSNPFAPVNSKTGDTFQIQYPSERQLELKKMKYYRNWRELSVSLIEWRRNLDL
jgi:hypothetical protein